MRGHSGWIGAFVVVGLVGGSLIAVGPAGAASKPSAPAKPSVAAGKAQVRVTWVAPADNGSKITGYVVTPFLGSKAQPAHTFDSTALAEVVTPLTNGRSYTFKVAARNAVGTGAESVVSSPVTPTATPTLRVATNTTLHKQILVNAAGMTLYLFTPDGSSKTSTAGPLLQTWPPVTWSGTPSVGPGLTSSKATVHFQPNRAPQVSYNNHLLYTFVEDTKPGDVTGQGLSDFFVVSPSGNMIP
jgi:predicted lipoprotein with Yx(FWY)xxD motif